MNKKQFEESKICYNLLEHEVTIWFCAKNKTTTYDKSKSILDYPRFRMKFYTLYINSYMTFFFWVFPHDSVYHSTRCCLEESQINSRNLMSFFFFFSSTKFHNFFLALFNLVCTFWKPIVNFGLLLSAVSSSVIHRKATVCYKLLNTNKIYYFFLMSFIGQRQKSVRCQKPIDLCFTFGWHSPVELSRENIIERRHQGLVSNNSIFFFMLPVWRMLSTSFSVFLEFKIRYFHRLYVLAFRVAILSCLHFPLSSAYGRRSLKTLSYLTMLAIFER